MKLNNYLGKYDSLSAVWTAIPAGGTNGDYIVIDGEVLGWNSIESNWTSPKLTDHIESVRKVSSVYGDMHVHHDLSVGGILRARVVRGRNAFSGLFVSASALEKHHPDPYVGQWALVEFSSRTASDGTSIGEIYRCETEGEWKATGIKGGYDGTLYEALETESEERKENDADILDMLTTEIAERKESDSTLQSNINDVAEDLTAEVTRAKTAEETLSKSISDETTARIEADAALSTAISDEATARAEADAALETSISDEATARAEADTAEAKARAAAIEAEAKTRSETDVELANSITSESTAREEADTAIQQSIEDISLALNKEATDRSKNDELLNEAIIAEKTARESDVERLSQAVWPLEVTLKASPETCEVGVPSIIKLNWTVKRKGVTVVPENQLLDNESVEGTSANKIASSDVENTVEYTYEATYEKMTKSAKATVKFVYASYFGVVSNDWQPSEENVKAMEKRIQSSRSMTKTGLQFANSKLCYCYPSSFGTLESIKDGNGYEVLESYTKSEIEISGVKYLCYLLTNAVSADNVTQIYK